MEPMGNNGRVFWSAAVGVIIADVVTKMLAVANLQPEHMPHAVLGEIVRFTLAYNPGAAFSMSVGPYSRILFGSFAMIALVILWRLYRVSGPQDSIRVLALGLAWGGAAGNLIDRITSARGVVDFIDIGFSESRWPTFNVADMAVSIGAFLLAWVLWGEDTESESVAVPATATAGAESGELS